MYEIRSSEDIAGIAESCGGDLYSMTLVDDDLMPETNCPLATNKKRIAEIMADVRRAIEIRKGNSVTSLTARLGKMPPGEVAEMIVRFEFGAVHLRRLVYALEAARLRALVAWAASGRVHLDPPDLLAYEREEAAKAASEAA